MVMITLYAKQKKRHRCTEQTLGLWEKEKVGCLEGTASKHVYYQGIDVFLYLLSQEFFFHDTVLTNERNIIKSIIKYIKWFRSTLYWTYSSLRSHLDPQLCHFHFTSAWTPPHSGATPSNRIPALQEIKHFSELHTMQQRYWNSNKFTFLPSLRLLISILIFPQTVDYIQSKCSKMSLTIIHV